MNIIKPNLSALAKSYNVLANEMKLRQILSGYSDNIQSKTKLLLHQEINEILINKHEGESRLKAKLVEMFLEKDVTAAFEMRVNTSRVDFLTINGDTKSFEIKSNIDNLTKLKKQTRDYEKVFENNYIVIDKSHYNKAVDLIPVHYGIYIMENQKLIRKKIAEQNNILDPSKQLQLLTKKELIQNFKGVEPNINTIIEQFTATAINDIFKNILKKRYNKKWDFLKNNLSNIFPVDYQFFFHHNIQPHIIYSA